MAIYEFTSDRIVALPPTSFEAHGFWERRDLQRLLRDRVDVVSPGTLVIAEGFRNWVDSKREIDLLGLDKNANLVVIELKRGEDSGHTELQAIRYAAMVSPMTFDQVVTAHEEYIAKRGKVCDARAAILEYLELDEPNEAEFAQSVRIVLVAKGFTKELTTAVMWLNENGLDIHCVQLTPYLLDRRLLVNSQQTIPLPEAEEFQVQIRNKTQQERVARSTQRDNTRYDVTVNGMVERGLPKNRAILRVVKALWQQGVPPDRIAEQWPDGKQWWWSVEGEVSAEAFKAQATAQSQPGRKFDEARWFCGEDDLIPANGKTYALSNDSTGWAKAFSVSERLEAVVVAFPDAGISFHESR